MIHIYPKYHLDSTFYKLPQQELPQNYLWGKRDYLFFYNAKAGIHHLIQQLGLQREDEVFISTTSDMNYVSTCVSATIFNYCKIARVLTDKTKLIYVIHEFGIPNMAIKSLVTIAKQKKIPLLEDCAHGIDCYLDNIRIGTFGDYALYSLPKHFPMENGGVLVGEHLNVDKSDFYNDKVAMQIENKFQEFLPYLNSLSLKRKNNFKVIQENLQYLPVAFEYSDTYTPYSIIFFTKKYQELYDNIDSNIAEWLRVYVKNWFCVPTQPLMSDFERNALIEVLKKYLR